MQKITNTAQGMILELRPVLANIVIKETLYRQEGSAPMAALTAMVALTKEVQLHLEEALKTQGLTDEEVENVQGLLGNLGLDIGEANAALVQRLDPTAPPAPAAPRAPMTPEEEAELAEAFRRISKKPGNGEGEA